MNFITRRSGSFTSISRGLQNRIRHWSVDDVAVFIVHRNSYS